MMNRIREIDLSQFDLEFDEEGNPTVILKRTGKPIPTHPINGRYLAVCQREFNNLLFHRLVYFLNEYKNGRIPDQNAEIHHIDEDKTNNKISNLCCLDSRSHRHHHKEILQKMQTARAKKWKTDPEFRKRAIENLKKARAAKIAKSLAKKAEKEANNEEK